MNRRKRVISLVICLALFGGIILSCYPRTQEISAKPIDKKPLLIKHTSDATAIAEVKDSSAFPALPQRGSFPKEKASKRMRLMCSVAAAPCEAEMPPAAQWGPSLEDYTALTDNPFRRVSDAPLSTFSIDVDTASYANMRRFLRRKQMPVKDAVRIEELINYFEYNYAPPQDNRPFTTHIAAAHAPWNTKHRLVRIALKGKEIAESARPALNLVFLLDVSGSMNSPNKLALVKKGLKLLVDRLEERDRVSIVVYAGASGVALPPTSGNQRSTILASLDSLQAGGSTHGSAGINLAYKMASESFVDNGVNRVILCTDGDFNVGVTNRGDLERLIEKKAETGVFLSVLGFGMGNYKDSTLEKLSGKGNGNYAYIDTVNEAKKVFVQQMSGTLITIAKDVKIQVEFNPAKVNGYRLIGYENRMLRKEDFNNDKIDAGEIGAGHTVTALYEIVPAGVAIDETPAVDALKYQTPAAPSNASPELLTVKLRYKQPDGDTSQLLTFPFVDGGETLAQADSDFRWAASVAAFGMILRDSPHKGNVSLRQVLQDATTSAGDDPYGYRQEFLTLVQQAISIKN